MRPASNKRRTLNNWISRLGDSRKYNIKAVSENKQKEKREIKKKRSSNEFGPRKKQESWSLMSLLLDVCYGSHQ